MLAPPGSLIARPHVDDGAAVPQQREEHNTRKEQHTRQSNLLPKRKLTTAQKKIAKQQAVHGELWRAAAAVLAAADPAYARQPFHMAVTKNFSGSPHIGTS